MSHPHHTSQVAVPPPNANPDSLAGILQFLSIIADKADSLATRQKDFATRLLGGEPEATGEGPLNAVPSSMIEEFRSLTSRIDNALGACDYQSERITRALGG
jgi:hypothetical protein